MIACAMQCSLARSGRRHRKIVEVGLFELRTQPLSVWTSIVSVRHGRNEAVITEAMKPRRNIIGTQIRRLRYQLGWSQDQLAARLQIAGFDISRSGIAKIENGLQAVADYQTFYFMRVFNVGYLDLAPLDLDPYARDFHEQLSSYLCTDERGQRNHLDKDMTDDLPR